MADSIRTEALRHEQQKIQLEHQQDREKKELQAKHHNDVDRILETNNSTKRDLEKAYELALSTTKDEQDRRMNELRAQNDRQLDEERARGEEEVQKVRSRYQEQIARYKENSEKALDEMRRQYDESATNLKLRAHRRSTGS